VKKAPAPTSDKYIYLSISVSQNDFDRSSGGALHRVSVHRGENRETPPLWRVIFTSPVSGKRLFSSSFHGTLDFYIRKRV
jgi:hypothetical protein